MLLHVFNMIERQGLSNQVDMRKVLQTVPQQDSMPNDITRGAETTKVS